jgi:integrase
VFNTQLTPIRGDMWVESCQQPARRIARAKLRERTITMQRIRVGTARNPPLRHATALPIRGLRVRLQARRSSGSPEASHAGRFLSVRRPAILPVASGICAADNRRVGIERKGRIAALLALLSLALGAPAKRPSRFAGNAFRREWSEAAKAAGFPDRRPHDFRRMAARNMERAGVPRSVAMALGGWRSESRYRRSAIASEADLRDGVSRLASFRKTVAREHQ